MTQRLRDVADEHWRQWTRERGRPVVGSYGYYTDGFRDGFAAGMAHATNGQNQVNYFEHGETPPGPRDR